MQSVTPATDYNEAEAKKFRAACKSIARDIRKFAASCEGEFGSELADGQQKKLYSAIERAHKLARFLDDPMAGYAELDGLIAAKRFAARESALNLKAARYAEMARLDVIIREKKLEARLNNGW